MEDVGHGDTTNVRGAGGMSDKRRERVRMEISREAARLFWERGVADTTGEQIAEAVGLSVRTIWRYFRNKESCAEPVMTHTVEESVSIMRRWPRELSIEDHLAAWLAERPRGPEQEADDWAAIKMIVLAETEPDLRTAWLMACDWMERRLVEVITDRLRLPADDIEARLHAAAVTSVLRVIDEVGSASLMAGGDRASIGNPIERMARAVRVATGGALGDAVEP